MVLLPRRVPLSPGRATVAFELTAPEASSVALVGDFNDWNAGVTPLKRAQANGRWEVTVPLAPGQYNYAFVVDGARWLPDPTAPRTVGDDFGKPNSVVTVSGRSL
jgi:1,4-alpha-glucan branching enzyme